MASRLRVSNVADVAFFMHVFESWMKEKGTRDLVSLLRPLQQATSWKTAPKASDLAGYAGLVLHILEQAPKKHPLFSSSVRATFMCSGSVRVLEQCSLLTNVSYCLLT